MTKSELIKALAEFDDDHVIILGNKNNGWSNIGEIKQEGCCVSITEDTTRPFSSDN